MKTEYLLDEVYGERLLISVKADSNELIRIQSIQSAMNWATEKV